MVGLVAATAAGFFVFPSNVGQAAVMGHAVGAVGDNPLNPLDVVGDTEFRALLGGEAIKYFIPLKSSTSGTYGVGSGCSGNGAGTCQDSGSTGGMLAMILGFAPVNPALPANLTIRFEDLDLSDANDPGGFLERLRVYNGNGTALTPWITDIDDLIVGGDISGNHNTQMMTLALGVLVDNPFYLQLVFKSVPSEWGKNTAEYLIASVEQIPIPPAALLFASGLACLGLLSRRRKQKKAA